MNPFTAQCQTLWRSILADEEASDMEYSDSEMDHEDAHGLVLGQLSNTQLSATQSEDSQDPDYHPTYPDKISETKDSEAEVVNRLESHKHLQLFDLWRRFNRQQVKEYQKLCQSR